MTFVANLSLQWVESKRELVTDSMVNGQKADAFAAEWDSQRSQNILTNDASRVHSHPPSAGLYVHCSSPIMTICINADQSGWECWTNPLSVVLTALLLSQFSASSLPFGACRRSGSVLSRWNSSPLRSRTFFRGSSCPCSTAHQPERRLVSVALWAAARADPEPCNFRTMRPSN